MPVAALIFLAASTAAAGAQFTTENGAELRFGNGRVELRFDRQNGRWLAMYDAASPRPVLSEGGRQPSVMLVTIRLLHDSARSRSPKS